MIPLSTAQQRLWYLSQANRDAVYNVPFTVHFDHAVDVVLLEQALTDVVVRHEALRTVFPDNAGEPYQEILDPDVATPKVTVLRCADEEFPQTARSLARTVFALESEIPLRCWLLHLESGQQVLVLLLHHIAVDGWSLAPLLKDLGTAYAARHAGTAPSWQPLPIQYADYAIWQREVLGSDGDPSSLAREQLDYWVQVLEGIPEESQLPTDRPRPSVPSHQGRLVTLGTGELGAKLDLLTESTESTTFMVALTAVAVLLSKLGAGTDLTIGLPFANRSDESLIDLVGFFVNTLTLRVDTSEDPSFRALVEQVRRRSLDAYAHQDVPFERVVEEINPVRSPSRHPIFQVALSPQTASREVDFGPLTARPEQLHNGTTKCDLAFDVVEVPAADGGAGALQFSLEYSTDLFDVETAESFLQRLVRLLEAALTHPDRAISRLDPLSAEERSRLLIGWNGDSFDYSDRTLSELFEEQVVRSPEATALIFEDERMSYARLNREANRVAHRLAARNLPPGAVAGIYLERSPKMVIALLAVLKAGGGYLLLDPDLPAERLQSFITDSGVRLLLTERAMDGRLVDHGAEIFLLDEDTTPAPGSQHNPAPTSVAADVACIMFTSGSTGRPKGVVASHKAMTQTFFAKNDVRYGSEQIFLQSAAVSWDAFAIELFGPLLFGGTCVLQPGQRPEAHQMAALVQRHGVTTATLSTGLFAVFIDEYPEVFDNVSQVMTGGDVASVGHMARLLDAHPQLRLVNVYGPMEALIYSTCHCVTSEDARRGTIAIGKPISNTQVFVLGQDLDLVPPGVTGELYIAGDGLAQGYAERADLTVERFIANPFGAPGGRMYRSGDLVRWTPDGNLHFVGRVDDQVKIRGFRVEPAEIQAVIQSHDSVLKAAVMVREDRPGDKRLVAYVIPTEAEPGFSPVALREHLAGRLPDYMVPSAIVAMATLPLNANGKIDRALLPVPDYAGSTERRWPGTPREEMLCGIFAAVLGLSRVAVNDNFFTIGGHSLSAMRLMSRLRAVSGADLPVRVLFDFPTVSELARYLDTESVTSSTITEPLVAGPRPAVLPLSFAQQRLWFLGQLEGARATYNVPMVLRLTGLLDRSALELALRDVIVRHESLRTTFSVEGGRPRQSIAKPGDVRTELTFVRAEPGEVDQLISKVVTEGFDLGRELPIRAYLFEQAPDVHVFVLVMHHIAGDGWSQAPLAGDLSQAYRARLGGAAPQWVPLPVQYADYALWQRKVLGAQDNDQGVLHHHLAYWQALLAGAPQELDLPRDHPRPATASYRGDTVSVAVPAEVHQRLIASAQSQGVTVFMVLQASVAALLHRLGAGTDIPIGWVTAGRTDSALDGLIGCFLNTLVTRVDLSDNPSFMEIVSDIRDQDLAAFEHQMLPFERMVEELNPDRSMSRHPIFQVVVALHNNETTPLDLPEVVTEVVPSGLVTAKFDLDFHFTEQFGADGRPAGLDGTLVFATDLWEKESAQRLADRLSLVLEQVSTDAGIALNRIEVLSGQERQQLLTGWNDTTGEIGETTFPARFELQAARTPSAVAAVWKGQALTYRELNEEANRLARRLVQDGVGPEVRVGLALPRSLELIIALIAIGKAGAAYVPLDLGYPAQRLAHVLADAGPACLLATRDTMATLSEVADCGVALPAVLVNDDPTFAASVRCLSGEDLDDEERTAPFLPAHPAYVIYTSGSTGRPKGVVISQAALAGFLTAVQQELGLTPQDRLLALTTLAFDIAALELYLPLITGAQMHLGLPTTQLDPEQIVDQIVRCEATVVQATPTMWQPLLATEGDFRSVVALVGGEPLPQQLAAEMTERCRSVINLYGPTEATIWITQAPITAQALKTGVPVGLPMSSSRAYVLDDTLQPVPVGVTGDLYLAGAQLARGYFGRSEQTAERFVSDPFGALWNAPGSRMYRSGDLARRRPDGSLEIVGRADEQVKIRGFRIELGEIEAALSGHPGVAQAVVVVREDHLAEKRLVAYVAATAGVTLSVDELREHVAGLLPEYMAPSAFVALDAVPRTPNGKLDRKALPAPDYSLVSTDTTSGAPKDERERALCDIFADILGVARVGRDDSFFALGGHSLLVARLTSEVRKLWDLEIPVRAVFHRPTPAGLAAFLAESGRIVADPDLGEIIDVAAEAGLDPEITAVGKPRPEVRPSSEVSERRRIFLTGATGFLGAFLLRELLDRTEADVYCLVRADTDPEGMDRIRAVLTRYRLWDEGRVARVIAIAGDLERPLLGLDQARFDALSRSIDTVYHAGSRVNHLEPYSRLRAANVLGTHEVLRLASRARVKPVHYVSTASTHSGTDTSAPIPEEFANAPISSTVGYITSKLVGEEMIRAAAGRGIPTTVHRPGRITGDSRSGACGHEDSFWNLLRAMVQTKAAPQIPLDHLNLVPVDYVARGIVTIAEQADTVDRIFHLVSPRDTRISEVVEVLRARGYELGELPFDEWLENLKVISDRKALQGDSSLAPAVLLSAGFQRRTQVLRWDDSAAREVLGEAGVVCPMPNERSVRASIDYFVEEEFFPAPTSNPQADRRQG